MADAELNILIKARNQAKAEFDKLNKQITQLQGTDSTGVKGLKNKLKQLGSTANEVSQQITGLNLSTMAGAAGIGMLVKMYQDAISETMNYAFQVRTLSRDIGATPEDVSKLIQAADDAQVSFETLKNTMVIANKQGIDVTISGLMKLADTYNSIQDPLARTKFLTDTFGRSGEQMGALMQMGSSGIQAAGIEAEKYGRVLSESAIQKTEDFRIAQDNLNDSMGRLKDTMALEVMPVLTTLLNTVTPVINAYNQMKTKLNELDPALKAIILTLYSWVDPINAVLQPINMLIDAFKKLFKIKDDVANQPAITGGATSRGSIYDTSQPGTNRGNIYGKAKGGGVMANKPYFVGESGIEMFIPNQGGTIIPNNQLGGGQTINVTLVYSPAVSLSDRTEAETKLLPFIKSGLAKAGVKIG